ncbi:MAG: metal-sulfur cluster assembly factor [Azoarcus sp.]|jgi:metal-sulfur cluster biosynthetic enzyme|nr:metal-sulfur cluster assembly factor [Azoarcus sp.]
MLDEQKIRDALRVVIDPEIGANIIDLGLIYRIALSPEAVEIDMTTTSPACPMSGVLVEEVEEILADLLPSDIQINVRLVWEPPWTPERMSEATRARFGW